MNLNPRQAEAVSHKNGPLLIIAGAGSGKTKTLTSRLLELIKSGIKPERIIAITFTNKAAEEMRSRVHELNQLNIKTLQDETATPTPKNSLAHQPPNSSTAQPFIGTFHSFGAKILKSEAKTLKRNSAFSIFDEDDALSLLKAAIKSLNLNSERYKPGFIMSQISKIKSLLIEPEEILDEKSLAVFQMYENLLAQNNAFDFDDLIEKPVKIFLDNPKILEAHQNKLEHILVDEYQDVNTSQYTLVRLLAQKNKNLSVVGDDAQAIYSWRHADFRNFLNFEKDWPEASIVKLEQNYRSSGNIITAASAVIKNNKFQKPKNLWTENPPGEIIKINCARDAEEEADFITSTINQLNDSPQKPISPLTVAILYRTNAQSRALEQALIQEQMPYKIFGGLKFYERKEIKDIVAGLRIAFNPKDQISAERLKKTFSKNTGITLVSELIRIGRDLSILELINLFLSKSGYFEHLDKKFKNADERIENINEFISYASGFKNLGEFLEKVSLLQSADAPAKKEFNQLNGYARQKKLVNPLTVNLMTVHLAKGLEFDKVFIAGCNEGIMPHRMSYDSEESFEEERRLMYVAMTRAKKILTISFFGIPSRFLYEIPPELTEFSNPKGHYKELPEEDILYLD